ncbi:MAG: hypothetical protein ABF778_07060 [Liquorilactobacillus hordei]|uniref:hypothetical protein n=1 Tax=Liquorilactobacillus hordei TaxID=468911 RepID=UPI0039EA4A7F
MDLWFYLDKVSILLGLAGSLASGITFFLALKVKSNVSKIIGKLEFKNEFEKLSGQTESYLKLLDNYEKANLNRLKIQLNDFSTDLLSKYDFFPFKVKRYIKQLKKFDLDSISDEKSLLKLRSIIIKLRNSIEREGKI